MKVGFRLHHLKNKIIGNRNLVSSFVDVLYDSDGETSVVSKYTISTMVEAYGMHMRVAIE